jgi:hypothetical protein
MKISFFFGRFSKENGYLRSKYKVTLIGSAGNAALLT